MEMSKNNEIIITSQIEVKQDCIDAFIGIARDVIAATQKEKGCLEYRFLQDPFNATRFFFYEKYDNKNSQTFHARQDYLLTFKSLREPMLQQQPILNIYEVIVAL